MTDIRKQPNWQASLTDYAASVAAMPFDPATHHCAFFAAGAVRAMTGVDLAAKWRGRTKTVAAGLRALRRAGFDDHVALVAAHFDEVPPAFAQVGDIAVLATEGQPALGIVAGPVVYVLHPHGLGTVPLTDAQRAFRVA